MLTEKNHNKSGDPSNSVLRILFKMASKERNSGRTMPARQRIESVSLEGLVGKINIIL